MSLTAVGYAKQSSTTQIVQTQESNDIIVLKNATRIDAIIVEVDDNVIRYRKASNPNGPLFSQRTSEIASVIYANGEVQTFSAVASNIEQNQTVQNENLSNNNNTNSSESSKNKPKLQYNPRPTDNYIVGLTIGYVQKQLKEHYEETYKGETNEEDLTGSFLLGRNKKSTPAMTLGLTINPTFKYGLGLRTGVFMEYGREKAKVTQEIEKAPYEVEMTVEAHDFTLSVPLQVSYRYEIWNKISVMIYTGPVFSFGAYQFQSAEGVKTKNIYTYDKEKEEYGGKWKGFNALWGVGAGFQWDRLRLDIGGEFGMIKKDKYSEDDSYISQEYYSKWNKPLYVTLTCFF